MVYINWETELVMWTTLNEPWLFRPWFVHTSFENTTYVNTYKCDSLHYENNENII